MYRGCSTLVTIALTRAQSRKRERKRKRSDWALVKAMVTNILMNMYLVALYVMCGKIAIRNDLIRAENVNHHQS